MAAETLERTTTAAGLKGRLVEPESPWLDNPAGRGLKASAQVLLSLVAIFGVLHLVIRAMVRGLGMQNPWLPYAYQYFLGGTVFLIGMTLIVKARAADPARAGDRMWLGVLVFGFAWYASWHAAWILAALYL